MGILDLLDKMKDPTTITAEEDEEQMIMRRLRNNVDELQRGYRWLGYMMKEMVSIRGEPGNYLEEETQVRKAGDGRLVYKGCKLNNRLLNNFRPTIGQFVTTYGLCYAYRVA